MFCSKCGNKIPDGDIFCNRCGNRVVQENVQPVVEAQGQPQVNTEQQVNNQVQVNQNLNEQGSSQQNINSQMNYNQGEYNNVNAKEGTFGRDLKIAFTDGLIKPINCLEKAKDFGTGVIIFLTIIIPFISELISTGYVSSIESSIKKLMSKAIFGSSYKYGYSSSMYMTSNSSQTVSDILLGTVGGIIGTLLGAAILIFVCNVIFKAKEKYVEYLKVLLISDLASAFFALIALVLSFISFALSIVPLVISIFVSIIVLYEGIRKTGLSKQKSMYAYITYISIPVLLVVLIFMAVSSVIF